MKPEVAGIVVTHGTNTLKETAYFLDLVTRSNKPVIVVGAQRPASDPDSDGPRNLLNAVQVAVPAAREKNIPIVISTRVPTGRVFPLSATKGSALALQKIGCVVADNLSPQKARILLVLGMTKTHDAIALEKLPSY